MFKSFGFLGAATNTQVFKNTTNLSCCIKIVANHKTFECKIEPNEIKNLDVKRDEIGEITANAIILFENGQALHFTFGVSPKDCIDNIEIKEDHIIYNGSRRGSILKLANANVNANANTNVNLEEKYNKLLVEYTELNNKFLLIEQVNKIQSEEKDELIKKLELNEISIFNYKEEIKQIKSKHEEEIKNLNVKYEKQIKTLKSNFHEMESKINKVLNENKSNYEVEIKKLESKFCEMEQKYNQQIIINNEITEHSNQLNNILTENKSKYEEEIKIMTSKFCEMEQKYNQQIIINNENIHELNNKNNNLKINLLYVHEKFNNILNELNTLNSKYKELIINNELITST
jgi:DNA repair exonuclease SbcCD ATPase subunit